MTRRARVSGGHDDRDRGSVAGEEVAQRGAAVLGAGDSADGVNQEDRQRHHQQGCQQEVEVLGGDPPEHVGPAIPGDDRVRRPILGASFAVAEFGQVFGDEVEVRHVPGSRDRDRRQDQEAEIEQAPPPLLPGRQASPTTPAAMSPGTNATVIVRARSIAPIAAPQAIAQPVLCSRSARSSA